MKTRAPRSEEGKAKDRETQKRWRLANAEHVLERSRKWWAENKNKARIYNATNHAKNKAKRNAARRRWYRDNADRALAYGLAYRKLHKDEYRDRLRNWHAQNPEKNFEYLNARRARKLNARGWCSSAQMRARAEVFGFACAYCGGDWQHNDHVIPLSRGGSNWPANMRPSCARCNTSKSNKLLSEWNRRK